MRFTIENVSDALGLTAGILLALTLVPQIWVAIMGSNPANISLSWQVSMWLFHNFMSRLVAPCTCVLKSILWFTCCSSSLEIERFVTSNRHLHVEQTTRIH